ncbi:MAG TPA: dihydroorotate dehydrogenase electron transfer subunit [Candidatus Aminicenantes bacterium]|nr:dihydroorotate dehydrogenase electron transfer subunit [Candidatus Aminicenantes bacterium]HRY63768.1 dihydroorotate dehydrogenase electron transfer subunit [Candidatus Aminicenantes bacterium]HRZ70681.1 dihydroorotate dehydrogenase electron transfer subunit [Candidatus Aminicenantes bacterium]
MAIERDARLREAQSWGDFHRFVIDAPAVGREARPGQFVMVRVSDGTAPLLRRPLGIHDADGNGFELFFKVAGRGTEILSQKKVGDRLDVLGPLGRGFTIPAPAEGTAVWLVGGGRGIAPLFFLARRLAEAKARPVVFYGGRTSADIPIRGRFERAGIELICSTDDGSFGFAGLVTALVSRELDKSRPAIVYACGPDPMMKALAAITARHGVPAEFSLESVMGCGIGACWGCVHRIRGAGGDDWVKICEEGPVFPGERILWP